MFAWGETAGEQSGPSLPLDSTDACLPRRHEPAARDLHQSVTALAWTDGRGHGGDEHLTTVDGVLRQRADENPRMPRPLRVTFAPRRACAVDATSMPVEPPSQGGFGTSMVGRGGRRGHVVLAKPARI